MPKLLLTFALLFIVSLCLAQKSFVQDGKLNGIIPLNDEGQPEYQVIGAVDNTPKAELFKRARKWFVKSYNSPKQVLELNDPETGELTAKGLFKVAVTVMGITSQADVRHVLAVDVKDNKYRIKLSSFFYEPTKTDIDKIPGAGKKMTNGLIANIDKEAALTIDSLQKALNTADDF